MSVEELKDLCRSLQRRDPEQPNLVTQFAYVDGHDPDKGHVIVRPPILVVYHPFGDISPGDIDLIALYGYSLRKGHGEPGRSQFAHHKAVATSSKLIRPPWQWRPKRRPKSR